MKNDESVIDSIEQYKRVLEQTVKGKDVRLSVEYFAFYGALDALIKVYNSITYLIDINHFETNKPEAEFILNEIDILYKKYNVG